MLHSGSPRRRASSLGPADDPMLQIAGVIYYNYLKELTSEPPGAQVSSFSLLDDPTLRIADATR